MFTLFFYFSSCTMDYMKCLILRTEVLFWSCLFGSSLCRLKLFSKFCSSLQKLSMCQLGARMFQVSAVVLQIISTVAKLFLCQPLIKGHWEVKRNGCGSKNIFDLKIGYLEFRKLDFILFDLFYKGSESNCEKRAKEPQEESRRFTDQILKLKHCCTV